MINIILIEKDGTFNKAMVSGFSGTFEEAKELKEVGGRIAYEVTTSQAEKVKVDYDLSIVGEKVKLVKGQKALDYEQRQKDNHNDRVHHDIGEILLVKSSKESLGENVSAEDNEIERLKSQLR